MRLPRRHRPHRAERRDAYPVRALLDFGASGARAALMRVMPDGAEILSVASVTGRSAMARPGQAMRRAHITALAERALSVAEWGTARDGELPLIADEVIVGLTGPLLAAHSRVVHLRRAEPMAPVYKAELLAALRAAQERALADIGEQAAASPIRRRLVASQLVGAMSVREDTAQAQRLPDVTRGVPGLAGEFLSIALCNLTWPAQGLAVLARVLDDLELRLGAAVPIAQAVAAALPLPDAILLDIGHESTEVGLVEGGALSGLASVPEGGQAFTQGLVRRLRLTEKHADWVKQRHAHSRVGSANHPVARALAATAESWHSGVAQALLRLGGDAPLPPRLYVFGGGAQVPEVLERLRADPWTRRLPFDHHPTVERLTPNQLRGLHDPRGLLCTPAQVGLAALAVWAAREPSPLQRYVEEVTNTLLAALKLG